MTVSTTDAAMGAMLGLSIGEAGGMGHPGQWRTDVAIRLSESLIERLGFDSDDARQRIAATLKEASTASPKSGRITDPR